jgi:hypothetical protein
VRRVLFLAAAILSMSAAGASAEWLSLRTEHLHVTGDVSAKQLKGVALRLEQFIDIVAALNQATIRGSRNASVIVIVFPDERSYRPFMPVTNGRRLPVDGMFISGAKGTYITINLDAANGAYRPIYHEYSHFLLRSVFGGAPLWFSEGLAEYYSTLEVTDDGRRATIGKLIPQHVLLLRQRRLPFAQLLSVTGASPIYTTDTPERSLLYAQSWALVHHALHAEPRRRDALVNLAFKLSAGTPPEQAVPESYGMTLADLEREVQAYVRREVYRATSVGFQASPATAVNRTPVPADEGEVEAWLGGVQMTIGRHEEGAVRLERALKLRPDVVAALSRRPAYVVQFPVRSGSTALPRNAADAVSAQPLPPPRNGGLLLNLRTARDGEQRTLGTLQSIECGRAGVTVMVRTAKGVTRASAASLSSIDFVTFRSQTGGQIACGPQLQVPALLTSRQEGTRETAVALELLPDGYVP